MSDSFTFVVMVCLIILILNDGVDFFLPQQTSAYKQGQIDAINGIIHYELVKNADGSVTWKFKNK